jgi:hypothetical protein
VNEEPEGKPPLQAISYSQIGTVQSDGRPISGATIRAIHGDLVLTTLTDETGSFVLGGMTPGVWEVSAAIFGFETAHQDVQIGEPSKRIEFTFQLQTRGAVPPEPYRSDCPGNTDSCTPPPKKADDRNDEPLLVNGSLSGGLKPDLRSKTPPQEQKQGRGISEIIGNRAKPEDTQIHWGYFYDPRSSILDAAPFSLNGQKNTKPTGFQNLFGVNIGVPMKGPKRLDVEKLFLFVSYTANLQRVGSSLTTTVPTLAERSGDFSGIGHVVYDPATGLPFSNNQIPASRISPIAQGLMQYIPSPNQPGAVQNFLYTTSTPNISQALNTNSILTLSHGDQIAAAFNWHRGTGRAARAYGFIDQTSGHGVGANVDWRHNVGTRISNNVTLSFNRNTNSAIPHFAGGLDVSSQLGIGGTSRNPMNFGPPNLNFTNFGALTDGAPSKSAIYSAGMSDLLSVNSGEHAWSFGAGYNRLFNNTATDDNGRGTFTFTGLATGSPAASGFDFADFLLGLPDSSSTSYGNSATYFRSTSYFIFGQDDYHLRPNMTLNLGLRYEFFSPWQEKYGRISNLAIGPSFTDVTVVTPATPGEPAGLIKPDRNNFAPRAAFAWKPSAKSKMTVRLGYAWFYDPGVYNQFRARLSAQPPFGVSNVVNSSLDNVLTLATGLTAMSAATSAGNTFAVKQNYRDMYAQTWNVSVQSDLPAALTGELAYIGTKGTHLDVQGIPNQGMVSGNATGFVYDAPDGNSIYHAGQARLTHRLHDGFSASLSYTYAKSIDDSSALGGGGNTITQNFYDLRAERGLSNFDRRHSLTGGYVWTSPFTEGSGLLPNGGWIASVLKAWSASGNIMLASGTPLTAQIIGSQFDPAGTGTISTSRASATGLPVNAGTGFFNLQAFSVPAPGQIGNAGRNTIPGSRVFSMNLSLQRTIRIGERKQLQIRLDSTNVTNHVNIVSVGTVVNAQTYGFPSAAGGMRTLSSHLGFNF